MIVKEKDAISAWEAMKAQACNNETCDDCVNSKMLKQSDYFCSLVLMCVCDPKFMPIVMAKMISMGAAIAEQKYLEILVK